MGTSPALAVFTRLAAAKELRWMARIGIYAGVFNPVHAGHIAFALQACQEAQLDRLYFLPERRPLHKQGVEHFGHRVAMLKRAIGLHPKFGVLELPDVSFSVRRTLPALQQKFAGNQLVFLFGSDAVRHIPHWKHAERFLSQGEILVGLRRQARARTVKHEIKQWPTQLRARRLIGTS
jgi:nicotinate-nucleotide adenylyltransferase